MMKPKIVSLLIVGVLVLGAALSFTEEQFVDVVHLSDGTVLTGLIVDQVAGVSLKLATADRLVYTLTNQEIERVEKEKTEEPLPFYYSDVVLLKDGVMFSGMIVEQRPDTSLTLRTENGVLLTFDTSEVWKILKEKRISGMPEEKTGKVRAERAGMKLALQIEIVRDQIREQQKIGGGEGIQEEIESLKEQMESLEKAEEQNEYDLLTDRRVEERERLRDLQREIEENLAELLDMLEQCEEGTEGEQTAVGFSTPEIRPLRFLEIGAFTQLVEEKQSDQEISEKLKSTAAEIVEQTIFKIPTQEEIEALKERQYAYSSLADILGTSRWKAPSTRGMMRGYAEMLPAEERVFLYETYKKSGTLMFALLNAIPAVYLGSWVQGDGWGALIGIAQTFACFGVWGAALANDFESKGYTSAVDKGYFPGDVGGLAWAATGLMAASYAFTFVEPFWYVRRVNKRLRNRLIVDEEIIGEVKADQKRTALNPPAVHIVPGGEGDLAIELKLVSLSY